MTRVDMMARMTVSEFKEWYALEQTEPYGEAAYYRHAALIAAVIANCNRGKNQPPFKPQEFMPKFYEGAPRKQQTVEEQYAFFMRMQKEQNEIIAAKEARASSKRNRRT